MYGLRTVNMDFYEIVVKSHLDSRRMNSFSGMEITLLPEGQSLISGYLQDQAALCSVIGRIHEMGIKLISIRCSTEKNRNEFEEGRSLK